MSQEYPRLVEFEFCSGRIIFDRVISLRLKKSNNFWLPLITCVIHGQFSIEIRNVHVSQKYTAQLQIWYYYNYFQQCYAPCTYVSWSWTIFNKSHILPLQSRRGHPCRINTYLVLEFFSLM